MTVSTQQPHLSGPRPLDPDRARRLRQSTDDVRAAAETAAGARLEHYITDRDAPEGRRVLAAVARALNHRLVNELSDDARVQVTAEGRALVCQGVHAAMLDTSGAYVDHADRGRFSSERARALIGRLTMLAAAEEAFVLVEQLRTEDHHIDHQRRHLVEPIRDTAPSPAPPSSGTSHPTPATDT